MNRRLSDYIKKKLSSTKSDAKQEFYSKTEAEDDIKLENMRREEELLTS